MANNAENVSSTTWTSKIQAAWHNFDKPAEWFVFLAFYAIAGFILGFLIKHFGRLIITIALVLAVIIWLCQTTNILSVNYTALREFLGISADFTFSQLINNIQVWVESHLIETIAASIGFVFGWIFT